MLDVLSRELVETPSHAMLSFFEQRAGRGNVVDLGAGHGRDSLALAGMGYGVTVVHPSGALVDRLVRAGREQGLRIAGVTADYHRFDVSAYDTVLLNAVLRLDAAGLERDMELVRSVCGQLRTGGMLCCCIPAYAHEDSLLKGIISFTDHAWQVLCDAYLESAENGLPYSLYAACKV